MKMAWDIVGAALGESWVKFRPLCKIWLPSMLIILILTILVELPEYRQMYEAIVMDGYYATGTGYWVRYLIVTVISYFVYSALFVNSWRYLINESYTPSWVPFRFDWKASFAVFGYMLLLILIVIVFYAIAAVIFGISAFGVSPLFMQLNVMETASMGARFSAAASYFGFLASFAVALYGTIYMMRGSMVLVLRSLAEGQKFGQVIKETRPLNGTFFGVLLISGIFCVSILVAFYLLALVLMFLPAALLFFLPPLWIVVICVIMLLIVLLLLFLWIYFFSATLYAELYRRIYLK